jgi:hypothetical protein
MQRTHEKSNQLAAALLVDDESALPRQPTNPTLKWLTTLACISIAAAWLASRWYYITIRTPGRSVAVLGVAHGRLITGYGRSYGTPAAMRQIRSGLR